MSTYSLMDYAIITKTIIIMSEWSLNYFPMVRPTGKTKLQSGDDR